MYAFMNIKIIILIILSLLGGIPRRVEFTEYDCNSTLIYYHNYYYYSATLYGHQQINVDHQHFLLEASGKLSLTRTH
jgi:hypothetical protein